MQSPIIRGLIDRRILVNYRVDPEVLARLLPLPFRPQIVNGAALVGICLIRLAQVRPAGLPRFFGIGSENAAHRAAVAWDGADGVRTGVYVRRRDTNSRFNNFVGGRIFPGVHHHASFRSDEERNQFDVSVRSDDGEVDMHIRGNLAQRLPEASIFGSLAAASEFFQGNSLGYSATHDPRRFEGLELRCQTWHVEPLEVEQARSNYFDNAANFPAGSIELDCALLMRNIEHQWHARGELCCPANAEQLTAS